MSRASFDNFRHSAYKLAEEGCRRRNTQKDLHMTCSKLRILRQEKFFFIDLTKSRWLTTNSLPLRLLAIDELHLTTTFDINKRELDMVP